MKNLTLGISTLSKLLDNNCIYVDKTEYAYNLTSQSGAFFLSRPRRFGKSMFVDTLKEIFEGNQAIFEGLYIHDQWDWTKKYPVIKLDFVTGGGRNLEEFDIRISEMLRMNGNRLGVTFNSTDFAGKFGELISGAALKMAVFFWCLRALSILMMTMSRKYPLCSIILPGRLEDNLTT